ncbi:hypothetical protein [Flavobacterium sp. I3-2]|uniref:hypothetical protein n=1 Tax=Flavobacterium sp. I3-2 TaxID=2748319 RepID=UPI0015AD3C36|nr:hypothetical protein [Flavobacterium sp. I3-2]
MQQEEIENLKKENADLKQREAALKKIFLIALVYNTNETKDNLLDYFELIIRGYIQEKEFERRNTLINQPNWIVNKKIEVFLSNLNQSDQSHQSQDNPQESDEDVS